LYSTHVTQCDVLYGSMYELGGNSWRTSVIFLDVERYQPFAEILPQEAFPVECS